MALKITIHMKYFILLFFCCFLGLNQSVDAQILDSLKNLNKSKVDKKVDRSAYYHVGFMLNEPDYNGPEIRLGNSWRWGVGNQTAFLLGDGNRFALGWGTNFAWDHYRLEQNDLKSFPDSTLHDKEQFISQNIYFDLFPRFYFDDKPNNKARSYIDLGLYGEWSHTMKHKTINEYDPANGVGGGKTEVVQRKLDYVNRWHYGAVARLNFGILGIFGVYRFNDLFKEDSNLTDLPKLMVGLQITR